MFLIILFVINKNCEGCPVDQVTTIVLNSGCQLSEMSFSCLSHVFVISLSRLCYVFIISFSCLCHIFVMSLSSFCHVLVISLSYPRNGLKGHKGPWSIFEGFWKWSFFCLCFPEVELRCCNKLRAELIAILMNVFLVFMLILILILIWMKHRHRRNVTGHLSFSLPWISWF